MIDMEEAYAHITDNIVTTEVMLPIADCVGSICAQDVCAIEPVPAYRASVMDGYAIRLQETEKVLNVVGASRAGESSVDIDENSAVYVTTGAPVPSNSDLVVPIEEVKLQADQVQIAANTKPRFIREIASDLAAGQIIVEKGEQIGIGDVALLASQGILEMLVIRKPVVGLLSTGNEIVEYNTKEPKFGQVRDSNKLMLTLLLKKFGCEARDYLICPDEPENLDATIKTMMSECDIAITSGGVSMGDHDFVKPWIEKNGEVLFGRLNMKPGKPTTLGKVNGKLIFSLPGNPVSCFVTFYLLVTRAIGHRFTEVEVDLGGAELTMDPERPEYHRATVCWANGKLQAFSTGKQQSSRLISTKNANILLYVPKGSGMVRGTASGTLIGDIVSKPKEAQVYEPRPPCTGFCCKPSETAESNSVGILTISDSAFSSGAEDASGPLLQKIAQDNFSPSKVITDLVPDCIDAISGTLQRWVDDGIELILTTGGTGMAPTDVTPEATRRVIEKEATGIVQAMMNEGLTKTPLAALSNATAGTVKRTLIINFPGRPKAIQENIQPLMKVIPHALRLLKS